MISIRLQGNWFAGTVVAITEEDDVVKLRVNFDGKSARFYMPFIIWLNLVD